MIICKPSEVDRAIAEHPDEAVVDHTGALRAPGLDRPIMIAPGRLAKIKEHSGGQVRIYHPKRKRGHSEDKAEGVTGLYDDE